MVDDLAWARIARIAANPPYLAADLTHRDLNAVMTWLTDITVAARHMPLPTADASILWLRCAVLTDRLGHADDTELRKRITDIVARYDQVRAALSGRLADRLPATASRPLTAKAA